MSISKFLQINLVFLLFCNFLIAQENDAIIISAQKEIQRSMSQLKLEDAPIYFLSYGISDIKRYSFSGSFGKLRTSDVSTSRISDIDLRVGSHVFDNTHIIRGQSFSFERGIGAVALPLDDNIPALRQSLWFTTDKAYKDAAERFKKAKTNQAVKIKEEDGSNDFSEEKPTISIKDKVTLEIDTAKAKQLVRKLSAKFDDFTDFLYQGDVIFVAEEQQKYIINSEGSILRWSQTYVRIFVQTMTKADDGMTLPLYESYFAYDVSNLPSEEIMANDINKMISTLRDMRTAPLMSTYTCPAILSGEAAGVFFHEIFGHRVEGHREKDPNSSQTFKQSIGNKILPEFITVTFDPTIDKFKGQYISGSYEFDDEGVKSRRVDAVVDGIFKEFLMSRSPIENFPQSNGHGRKEAGYKPVSRQSNLIVQSSKTVDYQKLKDMLRQECKKQDKEYGLFFEKVQGGFTFTGRTIPNAFNVLPILVYKIYADGRQDELVRGVDLIGTPLSTFSNIVMAADDFGVFNGICGAESGGVPVSACSPSLLISSIEVQKKKKSQAKLPILNNPIQKAR